MSKKRQQKTKAEGTDRCIYLGERVNAFDKIEQLFRDEATGTLLRFG